MVAGPVPVAAVFVLAGMAAACGVFGPAEDQRDWLAGAEERWAAHGSADYEYRFRRSACECLPEETRPYIVRVVAGRAVDARDAETGVPAPATLVLHTVPDLFAIVRDALDRAAHEMLVQYDAQLGYPVRISVDYRSNVADDEFTIHASELRVTS